MPPKPLTVGDRVRVVQLPPCWSTPGYFVHEETIRAYKQLIARKRSVRVREVDANGPWVQCWLPDKAGRLEWHSLTLDDGCWVRVVSRPARPAG